MKHQASRADDQKTLLQDALDELKHRMAALTTLSPHDIQMQLSGISGSIANLSSGGTTMGFLENSFTEQVARQFTEVRDIAYNRDRSIDFLLFVTRLPTAQNVIHESKVDAFTRKAGKLSFGLRGEHSFRSGLSLHKNGKIKVSALRDDDYGLTLSDCSTCDTPVSLCFKSIIHPESNDADIVNAVSIIRDEHLADYFISVGSELKSIATNPCLYSTASTQDDPLDSSANHCAVNDQSLVN